MIAPSAEPAAPPIQPEPRYWAFLSYNHADEASAKWLHRWLETYAVPKALVGTPCDNGNFIRPARLSPVFRDRDELPAGHSLSQTIETALHEYRNLIVVCSPSAASSKYVDQEIRFFQSLGRQARIFCLIVDGEPAADATHLQCIPEALRGQAGGAIEPLAADARPGKDGRKNAALKLAAGLIDVRFDELRQREQERRFRRLIVIIAALVVVTAGFAALAFNAYRNSVAATASEVKERLARGDAERQRGIAETQRREAEAAESQARAAESQARAAEKVAEDRRIAAVKAEQATRIALKDATLRRLALESKAMFDGARAGGQVMAVRLALAGYAIDPRPDQFGTLQAAIISGDGSLRAWEIPGGSVGAIAFSPDGGVIATAGGDNRIRFWVAKSGEPIGNAIPNESYTKSLAFSPDGQRLFTSDLGGAVRQWDVNTHAPLGMPSRLGTGWLQRIAISPSGEQWVTGSDGRPNLVLWDAADGSPTSRALHGHVGNVRGVAFSADGRRIVSGGDDKTIRLWDAQTGRQIGVPIEGHTGKVTSVAFSPDGRTIASGSFDDTVRLWRIASDVPVELRIEQAGFGIHCVIFSPDGQRVASTGEDGVIRLWDAQTGKPLAAGLTGHSGWVHGIAFSPDGSRIVSAGEDGTVRLWDGRGVTRTIRMIDGHSALVRSLAFPAGTSDHRLVAADYDGVVRQWNTDTGSAVSPPIQMPQGSVTAAAFSPDGQRLATASTDGAVRLWNASSGRAAAPPLRGHSRQANAVDFSRDGRLLVSGGEDGQVILWDALTGALVRRLQPQRERVWSVGFSPDGRRIASSGARGLFTLSETATGKTIYESPPDPNAAYASLAFSPNGRYIATANRTKENLRLWDGHTGRMLEGQFEGSRRPVEAVAFSPDGRFIAMGGVDHAIRLWEAESREPVGAPLEKAQGTSSLAFSADGRHLAAASLDNKIQIRVWDAPAAWPELLCQRLTRNMSHREWQKFVGATLPYTKQCPNLPVPND